MSHGYASAAPADLAVDDRCDPGGIVAPVFEALEALENSRRYAGLAHGFSKQADNSAHEGVPYVFAALAARRRARNLAARPGFVT